MARLLPSLSLNATSTEAQAGSRYQGARCSRQLSWKEDARVWVPCLRFRINFNSLVQHCSNGTLQIYAAKPGFGAGQKRRSKKADRTTQQKKEKAEDPIARAQQILTGNKQDSEKDSRSAGDEAPNLSEAIAEKVPAPFDGDSFDRRLEQIKKATAEQKALAEQRALGPIDYDAPLPASDSKGWLDNLGVKIGIGLAVAMFGLLFALGDFLPSISPTAQKSGQSETRKLAPEEASKLQAQVQEFEKVLQSSPGDRSALEGAAVSYAELGDFDRSAQYLKKVIENSPNDVEALRLLAEVQSSKGDYSASVSSYRAAIKVSDRKDSLVLVRGLIDSLLAAKNPSEAVGELLSARGRVSRNIEQIKSNAKQALVPPTVKDGSASTNIYIDDAGDIDPVTLELLLGRVYAAWDGHTGDAASVYDGLIKSYPEDFRGYLAKAVLLKTQNKPGDAERMFIQARYLAPPNSKSLVDVYSGRRPS